MRSDMNREFHIWFGVYVPPHPNPRMIVFDKALRILEKEGAPNASLITRFGTAPIH
jgi:hypothetical protein